VIASKDGEITTLHTQTESLKNEVKDLALARENILKLSEELSGKNKRLEEMDELLKEKQKMEKAMEEQKNEFELFSRRQAQTIKDLRSELRRVGEELTEAQQKAAAAHAEAEQAKLAAEQKAEESKSFLSRYRAPAENHVPADKLQEAHAANTQLHEKISSLEDQVQKLSRDLEQKDGLVREMIRKGETMIPRQDEGPSSDAQKAAKQVGAMFKNASSKIKSLARTQSASSHTMEREKKMEELMEDVLVKNIDLQKALDTMGQEMTRMQAENAKLKKQQNELKQKLMS